MFPSSSSERIRKRHSHSILDQPVQLLAVCVCLLTVGLLSLTVATRTSPHSNNNNIASDGTKSSSSSSSSDLSSSLGHAITARNILSSSLIPSTHPIFTAPRSNEYSKFWCIGGRGRLDAEGDRSCRFQNLCYRPATNKWIFYQDPKEKDFPVLLDNGEIITDFPEKFVNLRSMGNPTDAKC